MKNNIIQEKSYVFALRIIKVYDYLKREKREYIMSKQLMRSGTSIGANIEEAIGGMSKNDFIAKMSIAYKETRESMFWIRLLKDSNYFTDNAGNSLLKDCEELCKILVAILNTSKNDNKQDS